MSKQSKIFQKKNYFDFQFTKKSKNRVLLPNSAEKGKTYRENSNNNSQDNFESKKQKIQNPFKLKHRDKTSKNTFTNFYRFNSFNSSIKYLKAQDLRSITILGTFDKKILVGFNQNLKLFCFIDQHAMHQRIRYQYYLERLSRYDQKRDLNDTKTKYKNWNLQSIQKNGNIIPVISKINHSYITFKMTSDFTQQLEEDKKVSKYGFELQYIKQQNVLKIHKVPQILDRQLQTRLVLNIAHDILLQRPYLPKSFQSIIAQISCKSAYKFNDVIEVETIKKLLYNLSLCQYPFFCVHGRPTLFTKI